MTMNSAVYYMCDGTDCKVTIDRLKPEDTPTTGTGCLSRTTIYPYMREQGWKEVAPQVWFCPTCVQKNPHCLSYAAEFKDRMPSR